MRRLLNWWSGKIINFTIIETEPQIIRISQIKYRNRRESAVQIHHYLSGKTCRGYAAPSDVRFPEGFGRMLKLHLPQFPLRFIICTLTGQNMIGEVNERWSAALSPVIREDTGTVLPT
ncbi:hypothetical protein QUF72_08815 [Desulfobacterales bacterium HSG2]|nr:hypothetical protein [Desulfobacterales bacterium HSG2]